MTKTEKHTPEEKYAQAVLAEYVDFGTVPEMCAMSEARETLAGVLTERDRLREVNADLLAAGKEAEALFLTLAARFNGLDCGETGKTQALEAASAIRAATDKAEAKP